MSEKLDYKQIAEVYSQKPKYEQELDLNHVNFHRLLIETVEWKIPNLMLVVPPGFHPKTVAEIGCFNGHLIGNLIINGKKDFKKFGFDVSQKAINSAKILYPNVDFYCQDIFESGQFFDLLILSDIVEHIEDDLDFLKKCASISNNVLLNIPIEKALINIKRKYGFGDPSGHLRWYSIADSKKLISLSGFTIIRSSIACLLEDKVFDKIMDLKLLFKQQDILDLRKKKAALFLFRSNRWLLRKYFGFNFFAFLTCRPN
jgi:SAM-dependent methyltransferase